MSLIACTDPCVYQKDGYCSLSRAASLGDVHHRGCVNFVPKQNGSLQQRGHGLPDIGHLDQFKPLGNGQLPLDTLGDQTLGEA